MSALIRITGIHSVWVLKVSVTTLHGRIFYFTNIYIILELLYVLRISLWVANVYVT